MIIKLVSKLASKHPMKFYFFFKIFLLIIKYISIYGCFTYLYASTTCIPGVCGSQEEGTRSSKIGVTDGGEPLYGCWEFNLGPLEGQPVLLTAEPHLQPP